MENQYLNIRRALYGEEPSQVLPWRSKWETNVFLESFARQDGVLGTYSYDGVAFRIESHNNGAQLRVVSFILGDPQADGLGVAVIEKGILHPALFGDALGPYTFDSANGKIIRIADTQKYMIQLHTWKLDTKNFDKGKLITRLFVPRNLVPGGKAVRFSPQSTYRYGMYFDENMEFALEADQKNQLKYLYVDVVKYANGRPNLIEVSFFDSRNSVRTYTVGLRVLEYVLRLQNYILWILQNPPIKNAPAFDDTPLQDIPVPFTRYENVSLYRMRLDSVAYGNTFKLATLATGMLLRRIIDESEGDATLALMRATRNLSPALLDVIDRYQRNPELGDQIPMCTTCNRNEAQWFHPQRRRNYCSHKCYINDGNLI